MPQYLQNSSLFENLDPNDEEEFTVPDDCLKRDLDFTCLADLRHYLQTFQFWGGNRFEDRACLDMYRNCLLEDIESLQKEFYQIDVFTLVLRLRKSPPELLISTAIEHNATATIIAWLHEVVFSGFCASDCAAAAEMANLPVLKYLHEQGCPWDKQTIFDAIEFGHLDCLKYAFNNNCPRPTSDKCVNHAAYHGQIDMLKYFHSLGFKFRSQALVRAVNLVNSLACVKYLVNMGCPMKENATRTAALYGNLACLQYLHERGCPWDRYVTRFSASGQLACLIYAHRNGCPWDSSVTEEAVRDNQLACLQYAVLNGCPFDIHTFDVAVKSRSWRCAYFIFTHFSPLDALIFRIQIYNGVMALACIVLCVFIARGTYGMQNKLQKICDLLEKLNSLLDED